MTMSYCPSQDWDRHIDELDRAAEAEMAFYAKHGDKIERIAIALLSTDTQYANDAELVKRAANIAFLIYGERE
jgi:hypothetical protein